MAENIADVGAAAGKRGRGRPKGSKGKPKAGTPGEAAAAAKRAEQMLAPNGIKGPIPKPPEHDDSDFDGDGRRAPAFGANAPDVGIFLNHVKILRDHEEKIEAAKLTVKNLGKQKKDLREAAKLDGIVLGELDRALKDSDTEQVDLDAKEQRYLLYMDWLGKPINHQGEMDLKVSEEAYITRKWAQRGLQDGRAGKERKGPDGCPPDQLQNYLTNFDQGQTDLMRKSPLTARAFDVVGDEKDERKPAAAAKPGGVLTLHEGHFTAGTALEDANLKTLLEEHRPAFDAAPEVIAVFAGKKRILKEEGYVDDGEEATEVTTEEPLEPRELEGMAADTMAAELE